MRRVEFDREAASAGCDDAAGHAVAHRDRGAVGLGETVVAAQDDLVADRQTDDAVVVGRPVVP
jgi:hypothetical protein